MTNPTLSIVIPAYNEEASIRACLESIISQDQASFALHEIIVISDGSQDRTAEYARSLNHPAIQVIEHEDNQGMHARLNEGFKIAQGDFLFKIDADLTLYSPTSLDQIIMVAQKTQSQGVIMFREYDRPTNLIEKYLFFWDSLRKKTLSTLPDNFFILRVTGSYLIHKNIYPTLHIPQDVIEEDHYALYSVLTQNKQVSHLETPLVRGNYLTSWSHIIRQHARYTTTTITKKHFPESLLETYRPSFPKKTVIVSLLSLLIKKPQNIIHIPLRIWVSIKAARLKKQNPIKQTW